MYRFNKKIVEIETINGLPLEIEMWCSNEEFTKDISIYKCDVCNKEYNEKRRMLLHRNYHK